jgi:DNA topoisomerase IB
MISKPSINVHICIIIFLYKKTIVVRYTGIYKKNDKYYFYKNGIKVSDLSILERLNKYRVPPAWKSVWYESDKKSHIQVHGIDSSGKKQYILSDKWINKQKTEKFNRINYFIKDLNSFRTKIKLNNQGQLT